MPGDRQKFLRCSGRTPSLQEFMKREYFDRIIRQREAVYSKPDTFRTMCSKISSFKVASFIFYIQEFRSSHSLRLRLIQESLRMLPDDTSEVPALIGTAQ